MSNWQLNYKKSFEKLAMLVGFDLNKHWKKEFAKWLDRDPSEFSKWYHERRKPPQDVIDYITSKGYPQDLWTIEKDKSEIEERSSPYGIPKFSQLCKKIQYILDSDDINTKLALSLNVYAFQEKIRKEKELQERLLKLEMENMKLKKVFEEFKGPDTVKKVS